MITKNYTINISASAAKVWFALWDQDCYKHWTQAFCEGSYYSGELTVGNTIQFLTPSGEGMYSLVSKNIANESMFFSHQGEVKNFQNQALDEESKSWSGARENYSLSEENGICTLSVEIDLLEKHVAYFEQAFPKAMAALKELAENLFIHIGVTVEAPLTLVWDCLAQPEHILQWNQASADWHTTKAENDLRVGGSFLSRMEAKDGSFGFDLKGTYTAVEVHKGYSFDLEDGRKVKVLIESIGNQTKVIEEFEPENDNPYELQKGGWQAILNSFKNYTEKKASV
jgi:uncharacterized protein YndB with AHSA1/START domain